MRITGIQDAVDRLPKLVRFLGTHMMFGAAVGVALVSLILMTDMFGIRDLLKGDGSPYVGLFLLYAFFALTSASVCMGIGIMTLPWGEIRDMRELEDQDDDDDRPAPPPQHPRF